MVSWLDPFLCLSSSKSESGNLWIEVPSVNWLLVQLTSLWPPATQYLPPPGFPRRDPPPCEAMFATDPCEHCVMWVTSHNSIRRKKKIVGRLAFSQTLRGYQYNLLFSSCPRKVTNHSTPYFYKKSHDQILFYIHFNPILDRGANSFPAVFFNTAQKPLGVGRWNFVTFSFNI